MVDQDPDLIVAVYTRIPVDTVTLAANSHLILAQPITRNRLFFYLLLLLTHFSVPIAGPRVAYPRHRLSHSTCNQLPVFLQMRLPGE